MAAKETKFLTQWHHKKLTKYKYQYTDTTKNWQNHPQIPTHNIASILYGACDNFVWNVIMYVWIEPKQQPYARALKTVFKALALRTRSQRNGNLTNKNRQWIFFVLKVLKQKLWNLGNCWPFMNNRTRFVVPRPHRHDMFPAFLYWLFNVHAFNFYCIIEWTHR